MISRKWIVVGIALSVPMTSLPEVSLAQTNDAVSYCNALAAKWRNLNRKDSPDTPVAVAIAQCNSNPPASIPVLEKALTDEKVPLPPKS